MANNRPKKTALAIASVFIIAASESAFAGVEIPIAPSSVMTGSSKIALSNRQDIKVSIGKREVANVSIGELNRIVTPFENVKVQTNSDADININGNTVYVSTVSESRISMFISEKGDEENAISLTLMPVNMPSADIKLTVVGKVGVGQSTGPQSLKQAEKWEKSSDYAESLKNTMREIALGGVPKGYSYQETTKNMESPFCEQPGVRFDFLPGQVMMGKNVNVYVGTASNVSPNEIELREESCAEASVASVAYWSDVLLKRGQKTEVYVAVKVNSQEPVRTKRKSLID